MSRINKKTIISEAIKLSDDGKSNLDNVGSLTVSNKPSSSIRRTFRKLIQGSSRGRLHLRTVSGIAIASVLDISSSSTTLEIIDNMESAITNSLTAITEIEPSKFVPSNSLIKILNSVTVTDKDGFFAIDDIGKSPSMKRVKPARSLIETVRRLIKTESDGVNKINTLSGQVISAWADLSDPIVGSDLISSTSSVLEVDTSSLSPAALNSGIKSSKLLEIIKDFIYTFSASFQIDDVGVVRDVEEKKPNQKKFFDLYNDVVDKDLLIINTAGASVISSVILDAMEIGDALDDLF